jgi:hypothetical protein
LDEEMVEDIGAVNWELEALLLNFLPYAWNVLTTKLNRRTGLQISRS